MGAARYLPISGKDNMRIFLPEFFVVFTFGLAQLLRFYTYLNPFNKVRTYRVGRSIVD
jgi:hypothetical protein